MDDEKTVEKLNVCQKGKIPMNGMGVRIRELFRKKGRSSEQLVIGIIGTGRGVGTTHFSLITAGYASGILGKRCAVLEWNSHDDFTRIHQICKKDEKSAGVFRMLEADYYKKAGVNTLLLCKKAKYQVLIVDYGTVLEGNLEEFLRCDKQFVLGSLSEWQLGAFLEFEKKREKTEKSWETFVAFGSEEARENMEKKLKIRIRRIPFSIDAFAVNGDIIQFYQKFF